MKHLLTGALTAAVLAASCACSSNATAGASATATADSIAADTLPTVYFIREISPESLLKIYATLGRKAEGKVAVKISTGESKKSNQLDPQLIKPLVDEVSGTLVECCTAYGGSRSTPTTAYQTAVDHGYTAIAPVDIMDSIGSDTLFVKTYRHLPYDLVGSHFLNYDFMVVLSHFKGHQMAGFGGALKNMAIGIASADGKAWVHTAGKTTDPTELWNNIPADSIFQESMGEACEAIINHIGDKVVYINVANNLSVDCDCNGNPAPAELADLGIFASLDPVAVDRACVDAVRQSPDHGKQHLIERMEARRGPHLLDYAEQLGLGRQQYRLVEIK